MRQVTMTCPFTGLPFNAIEDADGNIYYENALTGKQMKMNFNNSIRKFNIKRSEFTFCELVNFNQAKDLLGVSRQRVYQIVNEGMLKPVYIADSTYFLKSDVLSYKENVKLGRPRKGA